MRMSIRNTTEKLGAQGLRAVLHNIHVSRSLARHCLDNAYFRTASFNRVSSRGRAFGVVEEDKAGWGLLKRRP